MHRRLLYIFLLSLLSGCSIAQAQTTHNTGDKIPNLATAQTITPQNYTGRQIEVGSGGGFTGALTTYYLLDNGKLFGRRSQDTTFTFVGQQTATNTKKVFTSLEVNCKIKTTQFNQPGNVYKFVQWRKGKQTYKVTWEANDKTVPPNYPNFFQSFMAMIPSSLRLN